jgi:hypothetical protein
MDINIDQDTVFAATISESEIATTIVPRFLMKSKTSKQSEYEASPPVQSERQKEGLLAVTLRLYVRPELRREGDLRDVTLGATGGVGEGGTSEIRKEFGVAPSGEGEGFSDESAAKSQKKESSGGEGAAFRNP